MDKTKMLLISNMYPDKVDKFYGIFVKNFLKGFKNTEIEIISKSLIKGKGRKPLRKIKKYLFFYLSICRNILKNNYDIIYIHFPTYVSPILLPLLPFIAKPVILNFHGTDLITSNNISKILLFLLKPVIQKSLLIVVPSNYFKGIAIHKLKRKPEQIIISPSGGIDSEVFNNYTNLKSEEFFTLGFVGRIDRGKGWDTFLKTSALLKSHIPNLRCKIAGNGEQVKELNNLIKKLEILDMVSFLGPIPHGELVHFYQQLDLFVFPTVRTAESLGLVGIEAMSCGIPVIGSRIGGLKDYIIEGVNGNLFEPGDPQDLAEKILKLYKSPTLLNNLKLSTRMSIAAYDKKIVSKKLAEKLKQISKNK